MEASGRRPLKNGRFCPRSRRAKILTAGIHRVFRGLRFEPNAEIGQKRRFFKGLGKVMLLRHAVPKGFLSGSHYEDWKRIP